MEIQPRRGGVSGEASDDESSGGVLAPEVTEQVVVEGGPPVFDGASVHAYWRWCSEQNSEPINHNRI